MDSIKEGKASINAGNGVFFNPKMKKLRDMSVLFVKALNKKQPASFLDCTAATGVRAIRYAKEAGIRNITTIDMNKDAYKSMRKNLSANNVKAKALNMSIQEYANTTTEKFDIIDLDPFGTPSPHVFDVMKISKDGTALMITATDTAVLCGAHEAACMKTYGSKPMHNELCKESGIRILLNFISRNAAVFNFGAEPLLSISDMHYMRVFVRLSAGAKEALASIKENGFACFCGSCRNFSLSKGIAPKLSPKCANCSKAMEPYGPMWLGKLQSKEMIGKMLKLVNDPYEGEKELRMMQGELDMPFFYSIPRMTKSLHMSSVSPEAVRMRLEKMGIAATRTQFDKDALKTTGTVSEVIKAIRPNRV
ncbi:MAG: methyltransferase [Candidatus Micrarchaeota archaeon]|nr:methyltransferase [Candidatus Micrarchaeota archaeon]